MEKGCGQWWCGIALGVAILLIASGPAAYGLDPTLDVSQYAHTAWTVRDGFSKGNIYAMTQTPDGYLWLGTEFGLFRFDGIRSIPWQPPEGQHLPGNSITSLLAARDGTLWIGTYAGLASWIGGKLTVHPELNAQFVTSLFEDRDGTVWAGTLASFRPALRTKKRQRAVLRRGWFLRPTPFGACMRTALVISGPVHSQGVWRMKPGPPKRYAAPSMSALTESDDAPLLMARNGAGLMQLAGDKVEVVPDSKHDQFKSSAAGRRNRFE